MTFADELAARSQDRLAAIIDAGDAGRGATGDADAKALLQVALVNEISVSELAASWVASTPEVDAKLAFARQAGDEAGHFQLIAERLRALGFDVDGFVPPAANPLFQYMTTLTTTVERVAAGLFALEAIAYGVNENFIAYCRAHGDDETVRLYETIIQPEEREHQVIGRTLLDKYATTTEARERASATVDRVLAIATTTRAAAAGRLGVTCFPGC
ncbi:MAG TPA: ferritin-like domain-containing protein [Kofleriaceae bacterium]|nr:ferritin-like domain-containing protein [Kofleriaceae bacterium]